MKVKELLDRLNQCSEQEKEYEIVVWKPGEWMSIQLPFGGADPRDDKKCIIVCEANVFSRGRGLE